MNLYQAELKYYLRSPLIWFIMALTAFASAWIFLLSIEIFTSLQIKFAGMSDAPTIAQGIIYPVIFATAKLLIVIIAIIGGLSFARLNNNNGWLVLINARYSERQIIKQKFLALITVIVLFVFTVFIALISLGVIAEIDLLPLFMGLLGLFLLILWMLALSMLVSSLVANSGFAILFCILVFMLMWLLSVATLGQEWGKNWLQVLSPFYHFKQFSQNSISYASFFYFIVGCFLFLWATKIRIIHKRYLL